MSWAKTAPKQKKEND